ncbi:MAG: TetR/AcrR family transcriptional regulator [Rhodocyclaceae bacterium]
MPTASKKTVTARRSARAPARETAPTRVNDPEGTMRDIIAVATQEFSQKGLAGARIDEIAELTRASKRMIYYYFGSKENLYVAVLEEAYRRIRSIEGGLHLEDLPPEEALGKLVSFTFDYQLANPDFIRLVMTENINNGQFLAQSKMIQQLNVPAITAVHDVYERGVAAGAFRPNIDPVDLHLLISSLCFFNVSNRHTFSIIFKRDISSPKELEKRRASIVEMVARYVKN